MMTAPTAATIPEATGMALFGPGDPPAPTPEKEAARKQQNAQREIRVQQQANARLPQLSELTDIAGFNNMLSNASLFVPRDVIEAIWNKFDDNTRAHAANFSWGAVEFRPYDIKQEDKPAKASRWFGQIRKKSPHVASPTVQDTRPEDIRRFPVDVPLMRYTALSDSVRLHPDGQPELLHANTINFTDGRRFIASQCPTKKEIPGLWEMWSKNKVPLIIDLAASEQYRDIQELGGQEYSPGSIVNRGTNADVSASCGVTCTNRGTLKLSDGNGNPIMYQPRERHSPKEVTVVLEDLNIVGRDGQEHSMQRLHFPIWKDFSAVSTDALRALANTVESLSPDHHRPVHVHCRAGVGRTGTLISFIAARHHIRTAIANDVACSPKMIVKILLDVIAKGRIDRGPLFVQTNAQFALLVESLMIEFNQQLRADKTKTRQSNTVLEEKVRRLHAEPAMDMPPAVDALPLGANESNFPRVDATAMQEAGTERPRLAEPVISTRKNGLPTAASHASPGTTPDGQPAAVRAPRKVHFAVATEQTHEAARHPDFVDAKEVGANVTHVRCPRSTAVGVNMGKSGGQLSFIHANAIRFLRRYIGNTENSPAVEKHKIVMAGQSPQSFALCEKFLAQGLDSGQGLFQFVSRKAHHFPKDSPEKSIISQLREQLDQCRKAGERLVLAGRYTVTRLEELKDDRNPSHDHGRFRLMVAEMNNPGKTKTILITQAGLKFSNRVLGLADIARASELMDAHIGANQNSLPAGQSGPMVVSYAGIGRNATLIAYREALSHFDALHDAVTLDATVDQIVAQGRKDRGPHFIHSEQQLQQLKEALQQAFALHKKEAVRMPPPVAATDN